MSLPASEYTALKERACCRLVALVVAQGTRCSLSSVPERERKGCGGVECVRVCACARVGVPDSNCGGKVRVQQNQSGFIYVKPCMPTAVDTTVIPPPIALCYIHPSNLAAQ